MQSRARLVLTDVNRLLDNAQWEAESIGVQVAIAVVDAGGHLLALRRLDGSAPSKASTAIGKARSAALGQQATAVFEEMINAGRMAGLSAPLLDGLMTGGVPIWRAGQVVGAIGVSGAQSAEDVQIAEAAVAA